MIRKSVEFRKPCLLCRACRTLMGSKMWKKCALPGEISVSPLKHRRCKVDDDQAGEVSRDHNKPRSQRGRSQSYFQTLGLISLRAEVNWHTLFRK